MRRLRGRAAVKRRKLFLSEQPLCVHCERQGRVTEATEVDHIVALVNGGEDHWSNLQGLCHDCHAEKTKDDLGRKTVSGGDINGIPLNPTHWWNTQDR